MKKPLFRGVGTALVTPFDRDGRLDLKMLESILIFQMENHVDAVILCGTTGESPTLSDREKTRLFRSAVQLCGGIIPVIAGVGSNDTLHTQRLCEAAQSCGVDGVLCVTPYYNKTTQTGAVQHFRAVASACTLPMILYNVPSRTGLDLSVETVLTLAEEQNICGIKEACGNMEKIAQILAACPKGFSVWSGNDQETLPVLSLGGDGVISVSSNLLPNMVHYTCENFWKGNIALAAKLQQQLVPLNRLLFQKTNPIPVKALMPEVGFDCGPCRLPLEQLSAADKAMYAKAAEAVLKPLLKSTVQESDPDKVNYSD